MSDASDRTGIRKDAKRGPVGVVGASAIHAQERIPKHMAFTVAQDAVGITWLLITIQVFGLASTWAVRRTEGSPLQTSFQRLFFAALLMVGAATVMALWVGTGMWLACGSTFSIMVVLTTCEFSQRAAADRLEW